MTVAPVTIPSVQVRFQKKGTLDASKPRPAKIVVEAGKITIVSLENKFPIINLKATNVEKPKRPTGKTTTWICLDIVQNFDAKYTYVNIQLNTPNEMDEVLKTLMIAWIPKKSDVFTDEDSFSIAPVHIPPPNKKVPAVSTVGAGRSGRGGISVDPEGSAHPGFSNDFRKQPTAQNRKMTTDTLKGLFNDFGVSNTSKEQPPMQVHSNPVPKPRLFERKQEERENVPVNTKPSAGIPSFYGNPTNNSSISKPTLSNSINRSGTKESLGPSLSRFNRSIAKNDHIEELTMSPYTQFDSSANNDNENRVPPKEKSLTSKACANLFDSQFKGFTTSSKHSPAKPASAFKSIISDYKTIGHGSSESFGPWDFKKQPNIGNSCYMNSTMQVLAACPIFVSHLTAATKSLKNPNLTITRFQGLMRLLGGEFRGRRGPVTKELLRKMREVVITLNPIFEENEGRAQQDAEECLTQLLGAISDECTGQGFRRRQSLGGSPLKTPIKIPPEEELVDENGEKKKKMRADCDPVDLMEVKMKDVKKCESCGDTNEKAAAEHRVHLGVEEEDEAKDSAWAMKCVQQLLATEVAQEEIIDDFKCEKCKEKSRAIGTKQFVQFGEYIIIVLKRFNLDMSGRLRKIDTPIRVPLFLETADFTEGGRREEKHNETIVINSLMSAKRPAKKKKKEEAAEVLSPIPLVVKTNAWVDQEEEENVETVDTRSDLLEDEKNLGDVVDREMEEEERKEKKEEKEERKEKKEEKEKKKEETEVILIDSSQPDSKDEIEEVPVTAATAATTDLDVSAPPFIDDGDATSPVIKTPATVCKTEMRSSETRRRSDEGTTNRRQIIPVQLPTTPTRKRGRQRADTVKEVKEERRSTGSSRSSLIHSEPTRTLKKSRLEGKVDRTMSSVASPPPFEVTIIDSDDEEEKEKMERQRRSSGDGGKKKKVWETSDTKEEKKEKAVDPFAFDGEEDDMMKPEPVKKNLGKFVPPKKPEPPKKPLANVNGLTTRDQREEESVMKGAAAGQRRKGKKNENVSPNKSSMEQTGGGAKKEEAADYYRSDEEDELMKTESGTESDEEKMDVDTSRNEEPDVEVEEERGNAGRTMDNVTRRSRAREERRNSRYEEDEKEEGKEKEKDGGKEIANNDVFMSAPNEEGLGSSEGGYIKEKKVPSEEEDLFDSPPDEMEEQPTTARGEEGVEKSEKTFTYGGNEKEMAPSPHPTPRREPQLRIEDVYNDEDVYKGELTPGNSPMMSPVKADLDEKKQQDDDCVLEEETEEDKEEMRVREEKINAKNDKIRGKWRQLFSDTDAPPPREYITFRPVDDRWMKAHSRMFGFIFYSESARRELELIRVQSNLCKITSGPEYRHTVEIEGDGNCLFRALSWWVTGSQSAHAKMRLKIVEFMLNFPDEFGTRMTGAEGQKYTRDAVSRMLTGSEWGTQCEIYGAATMLGVDIYTYHENRWKPYRPLFEWTCAGGYKVTRMTEVSERTRYGIYLTNPDNAHYDVVKYMEPEAPLSDTCYRLLGTIQHHGPSACSGHYVADVYDEEKKQWLHCDDDLISEKNTIQVLKNATNFGYVLIYGKADAEEKRRERKMKMEKVGEKVSVPPSMPSSSHKQYSIIDDCINSSNTPEC